MRVLEVPATGSFLLTDGSRELREFLVAGEHVAVYEGLDDFVRSLRFWLERPDERERISERGLEHVTANFSYDELVSDMLSRYEFIATQTPDDHVR